MTRRALHRQSIRAQPGQELIRLVGDKRFRLLCEGYGLGTFGSLAWAGFQSEANDDGGTGLRTRQSVESVGCNAPRSLVLQVGSNLQGCSRRGDMERGTIARKAQPRKGLEGGSTSSWEPMISAVKVVGPTDIILEQALLFPRTDGTGVFSFQGGTICAAKKLVLVGPTRQLYLPTSYATLFAPSSELFSAPINRMEFVPIPRIINSSL